MNWNTDLVKKEINKKTEKLNSIEEKIFNIISKNDAPLKVNKIKMLSGLSIKETQTILFSLELKGFINPGPGQTFWA